MEKQVAGRRLIPPPCNRRAVCFDPRLNKTLKEIPYEVLSRVAR